MFKTTKAKVIFVMIFCIICIAITLGAIMYQNIEIEENSKENDNVIEEAQKDVDGINLKGTYNQNDLIIKEKRATKEKVEINYYQIDGLKDNIIQNNINRELESTALNIYKEKVKNLDEVVNVIVSMSNMANFSNIISFEVTYMAKIDDGEDGFYQGFKGVNFDLTTGEKLNFDNLFTSNAPMPDILRKSMYYSCIQKNLEGNLAGDLIVSDYGDIEDEISLFIRQYRKGKITDFSFSPKYINVYYEDNNIINISMKEYYNYIAIYNRYLTDTSIYEKNDIGLKNLYTLSDRNASGYTYMNYQKGSKYFIDINISNYDGDDNEISSKIVKDKISELEAEIEKVKSLAYKNQDNFYILNYSIYIATSYESSLMQNITYCMTTGNSYEITVHDFEENIEPKIMNINRNDTEGEIPNYIYDFSQELKIEPQLNIEYYLPETGEKIVI